MGFFSWETSDTEQSIPAAASCRPALPVKMIDCNGREWLEHNYQGYGKFGGKNYYEAAGESLGITDTEAIAIQFEHRHPLRAKLPRLVTLDCTAAFEDLPPPENCRYQGYFYPEDDSFFDPAEEHR